jgi:hypothetical protein
VTFAAEFDAAATMEPETTRAASNASELGKVLWGRRLLISSR